MEQGNSNNPFANAKAARPFEVTRYFSKVAGSKFIFGDGFEIYFYHGFYDLKEQDFVQEKFLPNTLNDQTDPRAGMNKYQVYKKELDDLIKKGNPLLYVQGTQPEALPSMGADRSARTDAEVAQADNQLRRSVAEGVETGDANKGSIGLSDVNASTVDSSLKGMVFAERPQPQKSAGQLAKEAAQAKVAAATGANSHSS